MDNQNFNELQITWNNFGETEPFWSVLTHENFKKQNIDKEALNEFYNSGLFHYNIFEEILQKHNSAFTNKVILDFGCGVGRITKVYSEVTSYVYGMDISETHLNIAKQYDEKTQFFLIDDLQNLPTLPNKPNIITSLMVLQHARPDIIKHQVGLLLDLLEKDGIALLHIPYYIENYDNVNNQINVMEMHFLPNDTIHMISIQHNCNVLEEVEIDFCGGNIKNCIYVIKKYRNNHG
jgi:SAM-dependent methyltransferase